MRKLSTVKQLVTKLNGVDDGLEVRIADENGAALSIIRGFRVTVKNNKVYLVLEPENKQARMKTQGEQNEV
jgi:hypothetical protein